MGLKIKQLKQYNEPFVPITTAEAVLVRHHSGVSPLTKVLYEKIEKIDTQEDDTLEVYKEGPDVILKHKNKVTPTDFVRPLLLRHDSAGHIVETAPMGVLTVTVNNAVHIEVDGTSNTSLNMGDDFKIDNNIIKLNWNDL